MASNNGVSDIMKYILGAIVVGVTIAVGSWLIQTTASNETRISVIESKLCDITKNQDRMLTLQKEIRDYQMQYIRPYDSD